MVSLTNEEEELVQALVECLAHALQRHDEATPANLNKTLVQKFVYLGAQEFDLSLTYSWYLAGSLVESKSASPSHLSTTFDSLPSPVEPTVDADTDETNDPDAEATSSLADDQVSRDDTPIDVRREFEIEREADPQIQPSEADRLEDISADTLDVTGDVSDLELPSHPDIPSKECIEFYQQTLEQYPLSSTDRFLQQFYEYHAPAPYTTLYVSCLHVRSSLRTLERTVEAHAEQTSPMVSLEEVEADLGRHISRVHLELADIQGLNETLSAVTEGTDLIEDAVLKLRQLPREDFTTAHVEAVSKLQEFYFQWVWKYPALKISAATATGPSADRIRRARERTFESFAETLWEHSNSMRDELDQAGLVPSYEDYPDFKQSDTNEAIVDFTNAYLDE